MLKRSCRTDSLNKGRFHTQNEIVQDRFAEQPSGSKRKESSGACEEIHADEQFHNKRMKLDVPSTKYKDWECLVCNRLFQWKRNLLSHLKGDHHFDLTEVQKYVQHNRLGKGEEACYYTCTRHKLLRFESKDACIQHVKNIHKLGYAKARSMVVRVEVDQETKTQIERNEENNELETQSLPGLSPASMECPPLSPMTTENDVTNGEMPKLVAVNSEDPIPQQEENMAVRPDSPRVSTACQVKSSSTSKLWGCCLCGHRTTSREVAKKHLYTNHNMSRKNSERFVKYLGEDEDDDEFEYDDLALDDDDTDATYVPKKKIQSRNGKYKPWRCSMCDCRYVHRKDLARHRKLKHSTPAGVGIMWSPSTMPKIEVQEEVTEEEIVGAGVNLEELSKEKEWACTTCGRKYYRRLDVHRHVKQKHQHPDDKIHEVVIHQTEVSPEEWDNMQEPMEDEDEEYNRSTMYPLECGICEMKFKKRSQLSRHLTDKHFLSDKDHEFYIQRNEDFKRRWKCLKCAKKYFYRFDVCRHVNQYHRVEWEKSQDYIQHLEEDALSSGDEAVNDGKPLMCGRCKKGFLSKRSLICHLEEFHKCSMTAENLGDFVKDMRQIAHPILDYMDLSVVDLTGKVRTTELVNHVIKQTKNVADNGALSNSDSNLIGKVQCLEIQGNGPIDDMEWSRVCGTSCDSVLHGKTIYRPRGDNSKKKYFCTICSLRYYRYKEAQRHLTLKHNITYADSGNYIGQDNDVAQPDDSRPERIPKRRSVSKNRKYLLHCVKCLRTSWFIETLKKHAMKAHKMAEENLYKFVCRTSNADALKLAYEDKMNFVCVLCGMTFKNRLDAQAHGPKIHPQYSEDDHKKILFQKTADDLLYVVHASRTTGKTTVFWTRQADIVQDALVIHEEDLDATKMDEEDLEESNSQQTMHDATGEDSLQSSGTSEKEVKARRKSRTKTTNRDKEIEDFMCIMLDHYSQLGTYSRTLFILTFKL